MPGCSRAPTSVPRLDPGLARMRCFSCRELHGSALEFFPSAICNARFDGAARHQLSQMHHSAPTRLCADTWPGVQGHAAGNDIALTYYIVEGRMYYRYFGPWVHSHVLPRPPKACFDDEICQRRHRGGHWATVLLSIVSSFTHDVATLFPAFWKQSGDVWTTSFGATAASVQPHEYVSRVMSRPSRLRRT